MSINPNLIPVLLIRVLPESPRWLIAHGRLAHAQRIIDEIAETNGKPLPEALKPEPPRQPIISPVCICSLAASTGVNAPESHGHDIGSVDTRELEKMEKRKRREAKKKGLKFTVVDLFKGPNLRKKTLNIYFNWFVNAFVYYGLSLKGYL